MSTSPRTPGNGQIQFGVFFQGVNHTTVWRDPASGSQTDFESFRRVAQTAERGLFTAFFLGEGLRLREHLGRIHELDVAGRPDAQTALAALAAVTTNIGLVATQNTTYNDPADLAHRLSSLDLLSGGRAAWNSVTTDNAWTGANFRRGGFLAHEDRYIRAEAFVQTAKAIWDSWADGAIAGSRGSRQWLAEDAITPVRRKDASFDVEITGRLPRSGQLHPVLFQAGDSPEGRDFAVRNADVIFSRHAGLEAAKKFREDIVARTLKAGRPADDVKIFPGQEFILAPTASEAEEKHQWVRERQVGPQTAIAFLEQFWGRPLTEYDPDGPLPDVDPVVDVTDPTRGNAFHGKNARELAAEWRAEAKDKGQSIRQFVSGRAQLNGRGLVGSYDDVADLLAEYAHSGAVDGFNITPWIVPSGLDDIVNELVPRLQDRGVYRTEYEGTTLRQNLGLRAPLSHRNGSLAAVDQTQSEEVA